MGIVLKENYCIHIQKKFLAFIMLSMIFINYYILHIPPFIKWRSYLNKLTIFCFLYIVDANIFCSMKVRKNVKIVRKSQKKIFSFLCGNHVKNTLTVAVTFSLVQATFNSRLPIAKQAHLPSHTIKCSLHSHFICRPYGKSTLDLFCVSLRYGAHRFMVR